MTQTDNLQSSIHNQTGFSRVADLVLNKQGFGSGGSKGSDSVDPLPLNHDRNSLIQQSIELDL